MCFKFCSVALLLNSHVVTYLLFIYLVIIVVVTTSFYS